ncbi:cyclin Pas1 [Schizosaccharomyces cryophilus OY26]|uniref:Cyclin Pas1 n=1 Tax=Schizosaccharomyces cryophilus (strain OY26 / ATCC MYA-4695 / CBS 11777 / NBRC 106824 / NRRL Y48691) TaxID=653667 RepID=S9VYN2_SCHCR|nr:cyclin Pas1 [Schizosaccharomyces cryophilus OY26]EPY50925.1 cyclin Pas1 [Schizosaccharomyces cryophilus OY26]
MSKINIRALLDAFSTVILSIYPLAQKANQPFHSHTLPLNQFLYETIRRSHTDYTTLILALYYFISFRERAFVEPEKYIPLLCGRRLFLVCLIAATKFLHDRSFSNRAWSRLSQLPVDKLLILERLFYQGIDYRLLVAKHVFARWSLLIGECCMQATSCLSNSADPPLDFRKFSPYWISLFSNIHSSLNDFLSIAYITKIAQQRMNNRMAAMHRMNTCFSQQVPTSPESSTSTSPSSTPIMDQFSPSTNFIAPNYGLQTSAIQPPIPANYPTCPRWLSRPNVNAPTQFAMPAQTPFVRQPNLPPTPSSPQPMSYRPVQPESFLIETPLSSAQPMAPLPFNTSHVHPLPSTFHNDRNGPFSKIMPEPVTAHSAVPVKKVSIPMLISQQKRPFNDVITISPSVPSVKRNRLV